MDEYGRETASDRLANAGIDPADVRGVLAEVAAEADAIQRQQAQLAAADPFWARHGEVAARTIMSDPEAHATFQRLAQIDFKSALQYGRAVTEARGRIPERDATPRGPSAAEARAAYEAHPNPQTRDAFAHARLREVISDGFLNQ